MDPDDVALHGAIHSLATGILQDRHLEAKLLQRGLDPIDVIVRVLQHFTQTVLLLLNRCCALSLARQIQVPFSGL